MSKNKEVVKDYDELAEQQKEQDLKKVLSTPEGKRLFRCMFDEGFIFSTTFTGNSWGAYNEGRRSLALDYFKEVSRLAPNAIVEIILMGQQEESHE